MSSGNLWNQPDVPSECGKFKWPKNFKGDRMYVRDQSVHYSALLGTVLLLILIGAAEATGYATAFAARTGLHDPDVDSLLRSEERRGGKESVSSSKYTQHTT